MGVRFAAVVVVVGCCCLLLLWCVFSAWTSCTSCTSCTDTLARLLLDLGLQQVRLLYRSGLAIICIWTPIMIGKLKREKNGVLVFVCC